MSHLALARSTILPQAPTERISTPTSTSARPKLARILDTIPNPRPSTPEDTDRGPDSGIIVRGVRLEIGGICDDIEADFPPVFDAGLEGDLLEEMRSDELGQRNPALESLITTTNFVTDSSLPDSTLHTWEMFPPRVPEEARIPRERLELSKTEMVAMPPAPPTESVKNLAQRILNQGAQNSHALYDLVAQTAGKMPSLRRAAFLKAVTDQRKPVVLAKHLTPASVVAQNHRVIEDIAFSIVEHERATGCFDLEAIAYGFLCLPAYADTTTKLALNQALRTRVDEIKRDDETRPFSLKALVPTIAQRVPHTKDTATGATAKAVREDTEQKENDFRTLSTLIAQSPTQNPFALKVLTPKIVQGLPDAERAIAWATADAIREGIEQKENAFTVLSTLIAQFPTQRALIVHFYQLLRKPSTGRVSEKPQESFLKEHTALINQLAFQVIVACDHQWHKIPGQLDIAFRALPENIHERNDYQLRRALAARVQILQKSCTAPAAVSEEERNSIAETTLLSLYTGREHNMSLAKIKIHCLQKLACDQVARTPVVLAIFAATVKTYGAVCQRLEAQADQCVEAVQNQPQQFQRIAQTHAKKCSRVEAKLFLQILHTKVSARKTAQRESIHARVDTTLAEIHRTPAQRETIISTASQKLKGMERLLFQGSMRDPFVAMTLPTHPISDQVIGDMIKDRDTMLAKAEEQRLDAMIPVEHGEIEYSTWERVKRTFRSCTTKLGAWVGALGKSWDSLDFMNIFRTTRSTVAFTAALATIPLHEIHGTTASTDQAFTAYDTTRDTSVPHDLAGFRESASSMYFGTNAAGVREVINFAPTSSNPAIPSTMMLTPTDQRFGLDRRYRLLHLRGATEIITSVGEIRVDQHDAEANVFNALDAYMRSPAFSGHSARHRGAYPEYRAGELDQSQLYTALRRTNARAHHILTRVGHGHMMVFGVNTAGNIVVLQWTTPEGVNMLAGEPKIEFDLRLLPHVGPFSRGANNRFVPRGGEITITTPPPTRQSRTF